jgi:Domain of unknown function (DUF4129)
MQPQEENAPRSIKLTIVAVALLALLAVVAFASRSGLGHESQAQPTPRYVSYAFTLFLIVFVLAIPVAAYGFLIQAREGQVARKSFKSRVLSNFATMIFFGFLAFMVIYMKRHHNQIFHIDTSALDKSKNALENRPHRTAVGKYEPQFEWVVFWIALAGIIVSAAAMFVLYRRQKKRKSLTPGSEPSMTEDLITSMSDAIDDLEAEPDARRAVIAAYARMEGVLGRHGLRRKPSETPLEYLRRILLGLTGRADAVQRLTSLFEQAKFSRRNIDVSMKQEAIGALREIRDDMEVTA